MHQLPRPHACLLNVNDAAPLTYSAKTSVICCEVIETAFGDQQTYVYTLLEPFCQQTFSPAL